ncbi:hypothetical protein EG329_012893 [Mollisiaceae sp. DMI_Dod_QoI]|nr:hypothetical protein EG329_012893 [Helotiales sp. DMI_Dod_QoI]
MEQAPGAILMALPPEIRNQVYHILLVKEGPIPIRSPRHRTFKDLHNSNARGSILYVNKQIHHEAIRIFYAYNSFIVGNGIGADEASVSGLKAFITYIPAELIGSIPRYTCTSTFVRNRISSKHCTINKTQIWELSDSTR